MTPKEKVEHIRIFCRELIKFDEKFPEFISNDLFAYFKHLRSPRQVNPFNRLPISDEDECIQKLFNKTSTAVLRKMYSSDFVFVKYISWSHFFLEHIDRLDSKYETLYHILGDDILYTEIYVPVELVKFKRQTNFYLPKQQTSI